MKTLIISYYFPPVNSIASLRPHSWAKYWSMMGHDVTVLTTSKEQHDNDLNLNCDGFQIINIQNHFKRGLKQNISFDGSNPTKLSITKRILIKLKQFLQSRGLFATARMPDFTDLVISESVRAVCNQQFDIMISTSGPYSQHLIAHKLKQIDPNVFWIADYRDLWTQNHIFNGLFPFTLIEEYLEKKVNTSANMITTVTEPLAVQIKSKYNLVNVEVIENGFDLDDLETLSTQKYWSDSKIRLVYTGSIYKGKQDPSPLLAAIDKIRHSEDGSLLDNFEVLFVGGNKADLDELIAYYNVSNWVSYQGFLPREDALRMQRDAHGLIFLEFEAPGVDGILTGKLFEYLASGTQIVGIGVTSDSTSGKLIHESAQGINLGNDSHLIQAYLIHLLQSGEKPSVPINQQLLNKYSRKKQAETLLELYEIYNRNNS